MQQCSILFVNGKRPEMRHASVLRSTGFLVTEAGDLPGSSDLVNHHVVIVCPPESRTLPIIAARLRAVPRFGRRLLMALVPAGDHEHARRDGVVGGFDEVLPESITGRQLAATIIKKLRGVPEFRCLLGPLTKRREAA